MLLQKLKDFCERNPRCFDRKMVNDPHLLSWVNEQSKIYNNNIADEKLTLKEKIISVLHKSPVFCPLGKKFSIISVEKGFRFCGSPNFCGCHKQNKIQKSKNNYLSNLNPDKIKKTFLEKYGVDHNWKIDSVKEKRKSTWKKNYGFDNPLKSTEIKNKISKTNLEKYGQNNPWKVKSVREKISRTNMTKYQRKNPSQINIPLDILEKTHDSEWLKQQHHDKQMPIYVIANNLGINASGLQSRFHRYNIDVKRYPQSQMEQDIINFLLTLNTNIEINTNNRNIIKNDENNGSKMELDIFIPEKQLAIEFCGLYWHSEISGKKPITYHVTKLEKCLEKSIDLVTIFSDEWEYKQEIVKNRLAHKLQANGRLCSARETSIYPISSELYRQFVDKYHLQGQISASIKLGAFFGDELVAVMSFGARRRNLGVKNTSPNDYEMLRFCNKGNIPGVGSKLFSHFVKNYSPHTVVSYADRRWGEGEFYSNLGFEFVKSTGPSYFYTKDYRKRHNRFAFRKDVIVRELGGDPKLTEWQNMQNMGYDRIWDCGTNKWIWNKK